jgi:Tol biopolymer transport system component
MPMAGADIAPSHGFRVAPGRRSIVWSTCHETTSLVHVNEQGALVPLHEVHAWKETAAATIPGTRKLVVLSERGGENAPWVIDREDREPPKRLRVPGSPRSVSVSPDGRLAVFAMAEHGIVSASIDGESTRTLTSDPGDGKARFTHDGRTVVFSRATKGGTRRVFAVDVAGGEPRPLLDDGSTEPAPSPIDDRIAYLAGTETSKMVPMIFDAKTGRSSRLSSRLGEADGSYESLAFSGDGRRVAFLGGAAGNLLVEVDAATGAIVRTINAGTSTLLRLSYDGNDPIVGREQWVGNLWMADGRF